MTVISKAESLEPITYGRLSAPHELYRMPVDLSYLYSSSPPFQQVFAEQYRSNVRLGSPHGLGQKICQFTAVKGTLFPSGQPTYKKPSPLAQTFGMLKPCLKALRPNSPPTLHKSNSDDELRKYTFLDDENFDTNKLGFRKMSSDPGIKSEKGKRVTFADAHGFTLTFVKYMTETTEDPPKWDILHSMVQDLKLSAKTSPFESAGTIEEKPKLVAEFKQPVANYLMFKERLDKNNVCLENIILKDVTSINGTVKVRNIAFEKKITIRMSFDSWKTEADHDTSYVKSAYGNDEFDTFQFNIAVPKSYDPAKEKVQFCIHYETDNEDFWDNNSGINYVISSNIFGTNRQLEKRLETCERYSIPNTYCELPTPQFNTWLAWENKGPFY